jgi:CRP/FNR family transcriptional regulator, anaerobic regulatory protein
MSAQPVSLPSAEAQELAPALERMGTAVASPRGTILFKQGDQPTGLLVLHKGKVRLSRLTADGEVTSKTVGAGHILGLLAVVSDQPYLKTAETLLDSELVFVERPRVMALLGRRADFWLQAIEVINCEMKLIRKRVMVRNKAGAHDAGDQNKAS